MGKERAGNYILIILGLRQTTNCGPLNDPSCLKDKLQKKVYLILMKEKDLLKKLT
jgi:hypothetical protein